ncbi:hypothetical protein [Paraburkholderia sp. RL17-337-BIB-A]|uniref:hypothetical protein n=1 Tax=Paraburkholderia sp. RL17-337-BIB-A TaxID=3031636 RepID=UPI0038BBC3E0
MVDRTTSSYVRLFEVRLLHHYWLDDGAKLFDALAADVQAERLLDYDVRPLLIATPTPSTQKRIDDLRGRFVQTALGFIVTVPATATLATDTQLDFSVSVADARVFDYTALTLQSRALYEVFDPDDHAPDRTTYRYRENVPVLSNLTGATRGSGANNALFLSREYPAPNASDPVESLVLSGTALAQLTSDNPGAATQQLNANAKAMPVFVNQGDAPVIAPPAGVTGAPARGVQLSNDISNDAYMVIQLSAMRADNDAFSFVDATGAAKTPAPTYQVRFKNRSTIWTYLDKQTGALEASSPEPLPLTFRGSVGAWQKPSRGIVKAQHSGTRITQLVSEIYV